MPAQIHIGDIGTVFQATVKDQDGAIVNLASSTARQLTFKKPDGVNMVKNAVFVTDGTDGKIKYVTAASTDLDQAGEWQLQGTVTFGTSVWHTDVEKFRVYANL